MGKFAEVTLDWADGPHIFRIGIKELGMLDEACGAGPAFIANNLIDGAYRWHYVYQVIRIGLIGGGMKPLDAAKKAEDYLFPLDPNVDTAERIMIEALSGPKDDLFPKATAAPEGETSPISPMEESGSPPSTAGA